jgi:5-methylthioadenosine/S-adenosylhomocysteine deaminase
MEPPKSVELVIDARYIIPVEPAGAPRDHALVVDGGRIVALAPSASIGDAFAPRSRVTLSTHALIPGLVNAHTPRGNDVDARHRRTTCRSRRGSRTTSCHAKVAHVSPEFVADGTLHAAAEMLKGGITCANDMYFYPDAAARAYETAGMRALIGMPVLDFLNAVRVRCRCLPCQRHRGARCVQAFAATEVRLGAARAVHGRATKLGGRSSCMRANSICRSTRTSRKRVASVDDARRGERRIAGAALDRLGATGPSFIGVHAVHVDAADIETLATQQCSVVHCPIIEHEARERPVRTGRRV